MPSFEITTYLVICQTRRNTAMTLSRIVASSTVASSQGVGQGIGAYTGVVRSQPDLAVHQLEGLDRRLPVDHGSYYVAVLGLRLSAHHDYVAVRDGGVDHGVTTDSEEEQCPVADEILGQLPGVPDKPLGQVLRPGGDLAIEGNGDVGRVLGREVHRARQVLDLKADMGSPGSGSSMVRGRPAMRRWYPLHCKTDRWWETLPKWLWAPVVTVVNSAGVVPISYFIFGRRRVPSQPG